jgi:serine/threonine-protein kinase
MKIPKLPAIVWMACVIAFVASVLFLAPGLPDRVATHFGFSGRANGWMPRSTYTLFFIVFGIFFSSFVIGISYGVRFFSSSCLNVPNPDYWRSPEHYPEACDFLFRQAFWFGALSTVWAGLLNAFLVNANRLSPPVLDSRALAVLTVAFLAGTFAWVLSLLRHFRNPPRGAT